MSSFRIAASALAAQLCLLAGCAQQPYEAPVTTPNPWANEPAAPVAETSTAPVMAAQASAGPATVNDLPNPNVGGTRHGQRVMPEAPPAAPAPAATPSPPPAPVAAAPAPAPSPPPPAPAAPARKPAKPAAPVVAKKAAPAAPAKVLNADAKTRAQAPLRPRPALESAGKQILGAAAPLRLITPLENDAGRWWYVETESGGQGWLRDSEIQH